MEKQRRSADRSHIEPFKRLRPPTAYELAATYAAGRDPHDLYEAFLDRYNAANEEAGRIIDAAAGDDEKLKARLSDDCDAFAAARRKEWWITPRLRIARLLRPAAQRAELDHLAACLRTTQFVNHRVALRNQIDITASRAAPVTRRRQDRRLGCGRPRAAGTTRSSARSGDSGDSGSTEGDGEPAEARPLLYIADAHCGRVNAALARVLRRVGQSPATLA